MYEYLESSTLENPQPRETFPNIKKSGEGLFTRSFQLDEGELKKVDLDWVKFQNTNINKNYVEGDQPLNPDIILMPGYHTRPNAESIDKMACSFLAAAEQLGVKNLYSIQTRAEGVSENKLLLEVETLKQFIQEFDLKEVILSGFSDGALKVAKLATELANTTENVKGLALINPVGLYKQKPFTMTMGFFKELVYSLVASKNIPDTAKAELDVLGGIVKDWRNSGVHFPKILIQEIAEMSKEHPEISSIKCPVIVIHGISDLIVDPHQIAKPEQLSLENQSKLNDILGAIFENSPKTAWSLQEGRHFGFFNDSKILANKIINFFLPSNDLPGKSQE